MRSRESKLGRRSPAPPLPSPSPSPPLLPGASLHSAARSPALRRREPGVIHTWQAAGRAPTTVAAAVTSRRRAAGPARPRDRCARARQPAACPDSGCSAPMCAAPRSSLPATRGACAGELRGGILQAHRPGVWFGLPDRRCGDRPIPKGPPEHRARSPRSARRGTARVRSGIPVRGRRGRPQPISGVEGWGGVRSSGCCVTSVPHQGKARVQWLPLASETSELRALQGRKKRPKTPE